MLPTAPTGMTATRITGPQPGADNQLTRHSDLKQINTHNVKHLQLAWDQSTGALRGHEGQPLVVDIDGTPMMYIFSAWPNIVQALDLSRSGQPEGNLELRQEDRS